jgi:hypothetical protein
MTMDIERNTVIFMLQSTPPVQALAIYRLAHSIFLQAFKTGQIEGERA